MLFRSVGTLLLYCGLAGAALSLAGCATPPPADDPDAKAEFDQINDPIEPANRVIFQFNDALDKVLLRPAAEGYRAVVPKFGRDRVSDFLANLDSPLIFANDLLQGNVTLAGKTLGRFVLNSTFGVLGVMDVAKPMGIPAHEADFGETMGVWGIGEGPYLVLPVLGPSNPRDGAGTVAAFFADPLDIYLDNNQMEWLDWTRFGLIAVSQREAYLDYLDDIRRSSLDYYATMRSLYRQRRAALIDEAKRSGSTGSAKSPGNAVAPQ